MGWVPLEDQRRVIVAHPLQDGVAVRADFKDIPESSISSWLTVFSERRRARVMSDRELITAIMRTHEQKEANFVKQCLVDNSRTVTNFQERLLAFRGTGGQPERQAQG